MKTITELRIEALRVIENIITLEHNVFQGCRSDRNELINQKNRLKGIREWAIKNDQMTQIESWFNSKNFGHKHFQANEIRNIFFE
jgi:hypothetical protein